MKNREKNEKNKKIILWINFLSKIVSRIKSRRRYVNLYEVGFEVTRDSLRASEMFSVDLANIDVRFINGAHDLLYFA